MSKFVKILSDREPLLKKFYMLCENTTLQKTVIGLFAAVLMFVDFSYDFSSWSFRTEVAKAASEKEVILYPSEKLSMIVLCDGNAPDLNNLSVQQEDTFDTEIVLEENTSALSFELSSDDYITDSVIEDGTLLEKEQNESRKKQDETLKNESREVQDTVNHEVLAKIEQMDEALENFDPIYVNNPNMVINLSESELLLLERLVQCEAGGESMTGKILVANVVINRVNSSKFPSTVSAVINAHNQFQPVSSGIINNAKPTQETKEAVMRALSGEDYSKGALYFVSTKYSSSTSWFDNNLKLVVINGNHNFYTTK